MADPIRVGVLGAGGRMGAEVCRTVVADPELELVAAIDPGRAGEALAAVAEVDSDLIVLPDLDALDGAAVDVAVDFTVVEAARANAAVCADRGIHVVIGTSGFGADAVDDLRGRFTSSNCLVVANFAIGAVLMMRFAELAAPWFETAEIIELHHDDKVDSPSGTATATAERMAAASGDWADDPTETETIPGARGASGPAGIPIHSIRMRGMVAHQEIVLGTTGQTLTLRHDSLDRTSFMPGVALAVKGVGRLSGVTVGLDTLLGG
ncbi:MAG: 4-hydroxy-tetrahydrodipicolinate reductase [Actinomycetota bacterium]